MTHRGAETGSADLEALRWVRSLPSASEAQRQRFTDWVLSSREHLDAFLRHKALDTALQELDPDHQVDLEVLVTRSRPKAEFLRNYLRRFACGMTGAISTVRSAADIERRASEWVVRSEAA